MSNTPERNLNPPPDDYIECPDCNGRGFTDIGDCHAIYDRCRCYRCHGDGVVSKAEERRELEAVIGDRECDAAQDRKMMEEDEKP